MRKSAKRLYLLMLFAFILGTHKGFLAVWKQGENNPCHIFSLKTNSLPQADQEFLNKGIPAPDLNALSRLLEDYLS